MNVFWVDWHNKFNTNNHLLYNVFNTQNCLLIYFSFLWEQEYIKADMPKKYKYA